MAAISTRTSPGAKALEVGQAGEQLPEFLPALGPQDANQTVGIGERLPGGTRHFPGSHPRPGPVRAAWAKE